MTTLLLKSDTYGIKQATEFLKAGELVAIPTETVYGLAADALNKDAVKSIFKAKGRPSDNPLIVHTFSLESIYPLVKTIPDKAKALAEKFWPGPLTIIMEKSELVPFETSGGLNSVAVRIPNNQSILNLMKFSGLYLAAPSANISGKPSPTTAEHVFNDLNGKISAIIDGGTCQVGIESTVISLVDNEPRLLRPGKITVSEIEAVIGNIVVDKAILNQPSTTTKVASPGMKYKHYAPDAKVILINSDKYDYINYINNLSSEKIQNTLAVCFKDEAEHININHIVLAEEANYDSMAHNLFSLLRDIDKSNVDTVYIHAPSTDGVGLAIYNRLIRAAGFEVINLQNGATKK